jgi:HlyD family secretion protein
VLVQPGQKALIKDWGGKPLNAVVRRVEPYGYTKVSALGIEEQRVDVVLDLTDPPEVWARLGHGYRVQVSILLQQAEVLRVPLGALFRRGDDWAVFVAENGRARLQTVKIGLKNDAHAEVLEGLREGDQVVLYPSDQVEDGVLIESRQ